MVTAVGNLTDKFKLRAETAMAFSGGFKFVH